MSASIEKSYIGILLPTHSIFVWEILHSCPNIYFHGYNYTILFAKAQFQKSPY